MSVMKLFLQNVLEITWKGLCLMTLQTLRGCFNWKATDAHDNINPSKLVGGVNVLLVSSGSPVIPCIVNKVVILFHTQGIHFMFETGFLFVSNIYNIGTQIYFVFG